MNHMHVVAPNLAKSMLFLYLYYNFFFAFVKKQETKNRTVERNIIDNLVYDRKSP